ncbi:hypothetical protein PVAND_010243 [Polypedilum vanderplanki]|uniref:Uncharacterized protein n=1 Tax=Polypedilum vanderplanki TaxID=319348 RepID=A0A9J6CFA3_POLVA|nr:hypothetical protein PVAND_010243 [Polypedilum vanderplanki]
MNRNKKKLSKTVLEMKFMKRTKIQQDKQDDETENIELLTDHKKRTGIHSNFIMERNWELIEKLRSSRLNYGMSKKQQETSNTQKPKLQENNDAEEENEDYEPKAKLKRYNNDDDDDY